MKARGLLSHVKIEDDLLRSLVKTIIQLNIKTNRAGIAAVKVAKAIAVFEGKKKVDAEDINRAMELTLPHRLKSRPFQKLQTPQLLKKHEDDIQVKENRSREEDVKRADDKGVSRKFSCAMGNAKAKFNGAEVQVEECYCREDGIKSEDRSSRRCRVTLIENSLGIPVSCSLPIKDMVDVNVFATLNSATLRGFSIEVKEEDVRINMRKARGPKLTTMVLDASGSMSLAKRMSIAKGIAKEIIEDSYTRRKLPSLTVSNGDDARVVLNPTRRYEDVFDVIDLIPTGGKTPLPSALFKLLQIARRMKRKNVKVSGILITDGKANVPLFSEVEEDLRRLCDLLVKENVELKICDTRSGALDPSLSYIDLISSLTSAEVRRV